MYERYIPECVHTLIKGINKKQQQQVDGNTIAELAIFIFFSFVIFGAVCPIVNGLEEEKNPLATFSYTKKNFVIKRTGIHVLHTK